MQVLTRRGWTKPVLIALIILAVILGAYIALRAGQCGSDQTWDFSQWVCTPGPAAYGSA